MSGAVMTRSQVGARPMVVSPSRRRWARGIPPSKKLNVNNGGSVLAFGDALDRLAGPRLEGGDDAPQILVVHAKHERGIVRAKAQPVAAALEEPELAAF